MIAGTLLKRSNELVFAPKLPDTRVVKTIGGRWASGAWHLPALRMYYDALVEMYPTTNVDDKSLEPLKQQWGFGYGKLEVPISIWPSVDRLYPFQKEAVRFLLNSPMNGSLLTLSPGLGKTPVSLISMRGRMFDNVLVVSPLSLTKNWKREATTWIDRVPDLRWGEGPGTDKFVVANYDTVVRRIDEYKSRKWDLVIFDESIVLKNRKSQRTMAMEKLRKSVGTVWELSGSPIAQDNSELWSQLHLAHPAGFPSFWRFAQRYCVLTSSPWSDWVIEGSDPRRDVRSDLRDMMFVRDQLDVLPDLPEYIHATLDVEMVGGQKKIYDEMMRVFMAELDSGDTVIAPNRMTQIGRLQEIVSDPSNIGDSSSSAKIEAIQQTIFYKTYEFPMIIWVHWQAGAMRLYFALKDAGVNVAIATGSSVLHNAFGEEQVADLVAKFQAGKIDVLIFSLGVGKYGHTLTAAKTAMYMDKTFDSDAYVQSMFRVRRIGLQHRPVLVNVRCPGSVDELVEDNLARKAVDITRVSNADLKTMLLSLNRAH